MIRVGDLIAIMEECDFNEDDTIDTDSLEFEVNTAPIVLQKIAIIIYLAATTFYFSICLQLIFFACEMEILRRNEIEFNSASHIS